MGGKGGKERREGREMNQVTTSAVQQPQPRRSQSPDGRMSSCWNSRPDPFGFVVTMGRTRVKDL